MDDSISSLQEIKEAKRAKSKKKNNSKAIKIVCISNPMKVKTSASKFRALVQELTGQHAKLPDPTKFTDTDDDVGTGGNRTVPDAAKNSIDEHAQEVPSVGEQPSDHHHHHGQKYSTRAHDQDVPFETFDEVFTPQMLENFTGLLPPGLL